MEEEMRERHRERQNTERTQTRTFKGTDKRMRKHKINNNPERKAEAGLYQRKTKHSKGGR